MPPHTPIRLTSPVDLVGIVPYLLGFHPTASLIALALRGHRILLAARTPLPTGPGDVEAFRDATRRLAAITASRDVTAVSLVGFGTPDPVAAAVRLTAASFAATGLPPHEAHRVTDNRVFCLTKHGPACCPPEGTPYDPGSTVAAACAVAAGAVALPGRDSLVAQVAPITGPDRDALAAATHATLEQLAHRYGPTLDPTGPDAHDQLIAALSGPQVRHDGQLAVKQAMWTYRSGRVLSTARAAQLTVLLPVPAVRLYAISRSTGEPWQLAMWTDLLRRAQPELAAGPGILLALTALQAGNGALAHCAIDRVLDHDPGHTFALLIQQAIWTGIDPATVATIVRA